jgi:hypothetical protein
VESGRRSELKITDFSNTVLAPELVSFRGILSVGVNNHSLAIPAPQQKHAFHFVKLELRLMFLPQRVAVLTDQVADFTEEEIPSHCHFTRLEACGFF